MGEFLLGCLVGWVLGMLLIKILLKRGWKVNKLW